jgi:hypothetical protein
MLHNRITLFLLASLLACTPLFSQAVNGSLLGSVTDQSNALIVNAKVVLTETNTSIVRNTQTNDSGNFSFPSLPPGVYSVSVEQTGFRKAIREKVEITVNSTIRVDLQLQPGQVSEQITITEELPILQTDRTDTGRKMEQRQVAELPLTQNRNFQGLVNLVPGAARAQRNHSEFFNSNDSMQSRVNGQSRLANNVQFEGVDNNHRTGLLTAYIPPAEAIQTVDVTTSNYEAELGRAGGAVMNVGLKSGTNEFHGSAYWFNRVSALAARRTDLLAKPPITYNYFGATFGGAIVKNKTFFFGDYLGIRDRLGKGNRVTMPSLPFRAGNFSGAPTLIYDPLTGNPDGTGRTLFPSNTIPTARISPISARLLALLPNPTTANLTGVNYERNTTRSKDTDGYDVKVDHNFDENNRISVRYSYQQPQITDPPLYGAPGGPGAGGFAGTGITTTHSAGLNYTRVFSPTLIGELRIGLSRYRNDAYATDYGTNASEAVGIRGVNISQFTSGLVGIDISGYSNPTLGYSLSLPWIRFETNWNFINNWTKTLGNHTLKFGVDYRYNRDGLLQTQIYSVRGQYRFRPGTTGRNGDAANLGFANAFASFLLDRPNEYGRDLVEQFPEYQQRPFFTYIQDKWQINKRLTLDLGMRYELYPPATPRHNGGFSNYNPADNTLTVAGIGNVPRNFGRKTQYTYFAPRVGLSFRANEKTVVRAGYGISYMPFPDNTYAYNFPVRQNNAFNAANEFAIPANGGMSAGLPAPLPFTIPTDGIVRNAPNQNYDVIPLDFREGYIQSWNLAIQRQLPGKFVLDVAYVGNRGVRVPTVYNLNAAVVTGQGQAGRPLFAQFGRNTDTNLRYVGLSNNYNSLQVKFDRRFSNGFSMTTAYTWSKAIDFSNDNGGLTYYINSARNRARSDFDRRHMLNQSYIWELPFGKGRAFVKEGPAAYILGGWQVTGILSVMSGAPLNITAPAGSLNAPGNGNNPNFIGTGGLKASREINFAATGTGRTTWFDPSQFAAAPSNTFGNVGRNAFTGPRFFNADLSLFRSFQIREKIKAEFRVETYNFTNTPQYPNPDGGLGNATFGQITNAGIGSSADGGSRQVQFGLRIIF